MLSDISQSHPDKTVNDLLARILPGASQVSQDRRRRLDRNHKGSKAQLIDRNLKRRVQLQELDVEKLKKKQSRIRRREFQRQRRSQQRLEDLAKMNVLENHGKKDTFTSEELKYLDGLVKKNEQKANSWEMDEDDKEDFLELQQYILGKTAGAKKLSKSQKRKNKGKKFTENKKETSYSISRRYPGLTPGLAPVGMSDEEDSSEEEEES